MFMTGHNTDMEVKKTQTHRLLSPSRQALPVNRAGGDLLRRNSKHWEHSTSIPTLLYTLWCISILLPLLSFSACVFLTCLFFITVLSSSLSLSLSIIHTPSLFIAHSVLSCSLPSTFLFCLLLLYG